MYVWFSYDVKMKCKFLISILVVLNIFEEEYCLIFYIDRYWFDEKCCYNRMLCNKLILIYVIFEGFFSLYGSFIFLEIYGLILIKYIKIF